MSYVIYYMLYRKATGFDTLSPETQEAHMYIEKIAESVRLCAVKTDKFKTCRINVTMAMPLDSGVTARALVPFMLQRRSAEYPDFTAFNRVKDELYGATVSAGVSRSGEAQIINFGLTAIDDRFALDDEKIGLKCVDLLMKLIFEPLTDGESFPADVIEQEKRLHKEAIENEMNDKRRYAMMKCEAEMFKNEAYSINCLGTVDEVDALTPDTVYAAWQDLLKKANTQITMVGSMDAEPVAQALRERFSAVEREPAEIKTEFVNSVSELKYIDESMAIKQGKLVIGFRTGMSDENDNAAAMRVAVDIFGGGPYSKLFSVVREKMSLCYYCSAAFFKAKGVVMVQSGIEEVNEEKAKAAILDQLSEVANGDFSDETFSFSVKALSDAVLGNNDTPETLAAWYSSQLLSDRLKTPEEYADEIRAVTRDGVIRAAATVVPDTIFMLRSNGEVGDENAD